MHTSTFQNVSLAAVTYHRPLPGPHILPLIITELCHCERIVSELPGWSSMDDLYLDFCLHSCYQQPVRSASQARSPQDHNTAK